MVPFEAPCRLQSPIPRHQEPVVPGQEEGVESQVRHRLGVQGAVPGAQTALGMLLVRKRDLPAADEAAKEAMAAGPAAQVHSGS